MPAQWTADVIGKMHLLGVSRKSLAEHLNYTPEYVSMVLNGKKNPKNGELIFRTALNEISCNVLQK